MDFKEFSNKINGLLKDLRKIEPLEIFKPVTKERVSKHRHGSFKSTKAYADDRQKQPQNRRKFGRRKRK